MPVARSLSAGIRRAGVSVAAAAVAVSVLAGCGSGGGSAKTSASPSPSTTSASPSPDPTATAKEQVLAAYRGGSNRRHVQTSKAYYGSGKWMIVDSTIDKDSTC